MKIYLGSDHRGYQLKKKIREHLKLAGYEVVDVGPLAYDKADDYVDYAVALCTQMKEGDRGVLLCGSGHGVDMVANRHAHIRSILGYNLDVVVQGREDEDANVLSLAAEWIETEEAFEMITTFIQTSFSQAERHIRRLQKIAELSV